MSVLRHMKCALERQIAKNLKQEPSVEYIDTLD